MVGQEINDVKISTALKITSLISGLALAVLAIYKFSALGIFNARDFFLTIYYIIFGILLALSEMPCKVLMSCVSFLGFYIGKALFCLFLGTIVFDTGNAFFLVLAIVFWVEGIMYFSLACGCKKNIVNKEEEGGEGEKGEKGGAKAEKADKKEENGFKSVDLNSPAAENGAAV
ncbi:unnamed protein product [Blepharisma stoltei]|uniref:COPI associated protein n=1 Tax=Blepharisma stoltei TaxID=1481888 RepID=A0AAU9JJ47_9CILI|nr:unnamed protein product [Blepharisma stoltei]